MKKIALSIISLLIASVALTFSLTGCEAMNKLEEGVNAITNVFKSDGVLEYKLSDDKSYYSVVGLFDKSVTKIEIPERFHGLSVEAIDEDAFRDCTSLTSVTIGDSVTSIGYGAFSGCDSLTSVTIGDSVTSIGDYAFHWCFSLTSITIPDSVTSIGDFAFECCDSLTSITIPDSVTSIGDWAFVSCFNLTSITIPDSVTAIEYGTFSGCDSLTSITIPDSVISIGDAAFYDCNSLTSITIPDSVTSIGDYAFSGCGSLIIYCEALIRPSAWSDNWNIDSCPVVWNCKNNNVADNGYEYAEIDGIRYDIKNGYATVAKFLGNKATANIRSEITISGKSYAVTSIRSDAFKNTRVTSIVLPNSITEIAADTFEGCSSLTSIVIPGSITSISAGTFEDCSALTSVKFEDTTTWYLSSNNQSTEIDVTNESDNARNLAKLYSNYTWIKR